jgi:hypothetical protein
MVVAVAAVRTKVVVAVAAVRTKVVVAVAVRTKVVGAEMGTRTADRIGQQVAADRVARTMPPEPRCSDLDSVVHAGRASPIVFLPLRIDYLRGSGHYRS